MPETTDRARQFDFYDPETTDDLYSVLAEMRNECPVSFGERYGGHWNITGYEQVYQVAHDWQTFTSAQGTQVGRKPTDGTPAPLGADPPLQQQYRRLLNPCFSPATIAEREPAIRD